MVTLPNQKEMMHGRVVELRAQVGDRVEKGQEVMLIQINERTLCFTSPKSGTLELVTPIGSQPAPGSLLFTLKLEEETTEHNEPELKSNEPSEEPPAPASNQNKSHSKAILISAFVLLAIVSAGFLSVYFQSDNNRKIISCNPSEYLTIIYDEHGNRIRHYYREKDGTLFELKRKTYAIGVDSENRFSLGIQPTKNFLAGSDDFYSLCDTSEEPSNCQGTMEDEGPTFIKYKQNTTQLLSPKEGSPNSLSYLYEFNYVENTLYSITPLEITGSTTNNYGITHTLHHCQDSILK